MLTCKQLIESLAEYVEGRLSLSRKAAFKPLRARPGGQSPNCVRAPIRIAF